MNKPNKANTLDSNLIRIIEAKHHDPFSVLGRHTAGDKTVIRAFLPYAETVRIEENGPEMKRIAGTDLFEYTPGKNEIIPHHYSLAWTDKDGYDHIECDPYTFGPVLPEFDQHLFGEGRHWHIYQKLGSHLYSLDDVDGVYFAVWAPNAERVSIIGDFNRWDGRCHPMRNLGGSGIWEIFIPGLNEGCLYKFEIRNTHSGQVLVKTDPYGQQFEFRPQTAAIVTQENSYTWQDSAWMEKRPNHDWLHHPMSIYEVHLGSWQRDSRGNFLDYRELAIRLVDYVKEMGFTHIELVPITEQP